MFHYLKPLYTLTDKELDEIREWRYKVNSLKIYRSRGYCEICRLPFGIFSSELRGHHIFRPSLINDDSKKQDDSNIVICCNSCYKKQILSGVFQKDINNWFLVPMPNNFVGVQKIYKNNPPRRLKGYIVRNLKHNGRL